MDYLKTDYPTNDPALAFFKEDAVRQGMSFRAYCRAYGIVIRALEQDRREYEVADIVVGSGDDFWGELRRDKGHRHSHGQAEADILRGEYNGDDE